MLGFEFSIKLRRLLVAALYDKVVNLSVKSMTETNSGKLVSLISADLFSIERGFAFPPIMIASPLVNLVAYFFLAKTVGWQYTLVTFGVWCLLMLMQYGASKVSRSLKQAESGLNDERLKVVNDLVVGARTIKCYGWEKHYVEKIKDLRQQQMKKAMKLVTTQSLGNSLFPNMGLVAVLIIVLAEWY